jgi:hypothetical protein
LTCGKEIAPRQIKSRKTGLSQGWFTPKKYCSHECLIQSQTKIITKTCEHCGAEFSGVPWHIAHRKYCSPKCASVANLVQFTGKPRGRFIDKAGYVLLTNRKGDNGYQQPEHRAVMERMLGRKLEKHETVHHKNGIRHDNRPENLELWSGRHGRGQRVADLPTEDIWSGNVPSYLIGCAIE